MEPKELMKDYFDRNQLAEAWGCSARSIARYENMVDGLPSVVLGRRKLYHVPIAMEWIANRMKRRNPSRGRQSKRG